MEKKKGGLLEELDRLNDEQVIELVDVVEEPEEKVSIRSLVAPEKDQFLEKLLLSRPGRARRQRARASEEELTFRWTRKKHQKGDELSFELKPEAPPVEDLFEKMELRDSSSKRRRSPSLLRKNH